MFKHITASELDQDRTSISLAPGSMSNSLVHIPTQVHEVIFGRIICFIAIRSNALENANATKKKRGNLLALNAFRHIRLTCNMQKVHGRKGKHKQNVSLYNTLAVLNSALTCAAACSSHITALIK